MAELLVSSTVHDRVEELREIGAVGELGKVRELLTLAQEDRSPAVRLRAAESAACILVRHRFGPRRELLSDSERRSLLDGFKSLDPGENLGLFSVLAALDLPRCLGRILVGLRDPRYDVRLSALVGLRKYSCSLSAFDDERISKRIIDVIADKRHKPDVTASLVEFCASMGWSEIRPMLDDFLTREDQVGSAAETALEILEQAESVENFPGVWFSNGLDMNEVCREKGSLAWLALREDGEGVLHDDNTSAEPIRWLAEEANSLRVTIGRETLTHRVRRLNVIFDNNEEPAPVIQFNGRVWYKRSLESAEDVAEHFLLDSGGIRKVKRERFVDNLVAMLPSTPKGQLLAARLASNVGRYKSAITDIKALISAVKKPKGHLYYYLAEAHEGSGDLKKAIKALNDCIAAEKNGSHHEQAEAKLAKWSEG